VVSCPACHAPKAQRRRPHSYNSVTQKEFPDPLECGVSGFARFGDHSELGLDPTTLLALLKATNRRRRGQDEQSGRLEVAHGLRSRVTFARDAIKDLQDVPSAGRRVPECQVSVAGPSGIRSVMTPTRTS